MVERSLGAEAVRPLDLDADYMARAARQPYGVIDIGSNSVRIVIYDQLGRAPLPRFNEKSLCRLGEGLAETGAIAPDNFRRTVEAVRRFRAIAEAMGVARLDATATEAIRRATNGRALVDAIRTEAGVEVRILSGVEEARFATMGVVSGFFRPVGTVGDMGGGSLEVAEALDDRAGERSVSLPLGALPVEALLAEGPAAAKKRIDALLEEIPPGLTHSTFYAVGGGWRAFARAHMTAMGTPVPVVHGYALPTAEARAFAKALWRTPPAKLEGQPGLPSRRARTMPSAALVLDRVLKRLAPDRVVFSALGLREGWLYEQISPEERYRDPLLEGAQLVGLPQARVARFAPALAAWTATLFPGETAAQARIRIAACALSDIAWHDHPDVRAEECFRRILQFPFIGIEHAERVFLAATLHARYSGEADAPWLYPAFDLLPRAERRKTQILGRAMKLAYRLSGGVPEVLNDSRLVITDDSLRLEVGHVARVPDSEVVQDRLKLLAASLGVKRTTVVERAISQT